MKRLVITALIAGVLIPLAGHQVSGEEAAWDRGYALVQEAYRDREAGDEETAREKLARALAIFRRSAVDRSPRLVRPEVDFLVEESPSGINLIENRTLFKIEFRRDPSPPRAEPADQEALLRQQQLIIQNLARVIQDNAELKAILNRVDSSAEDSVDISSDINDQVSDIRDETSEITELSQTMSDVRDRTDDIYDELERQSGDSETLRAVEDLAGEISDLKDAADLLRDILDIVQDIKDDTAGIRDLESRIDDVKSEVENLRE